MRAANVLQDYNAYTSYPSSSNQYKYGSMEYDSYYNNYHQQPNHSYSQPVGAYQITGAPYQPHSSFPNTGSYDGTVTYRSTYYNVILVIIRLLDDIKTTVMEIRQNISKWPTLFICQLLHL